MKTLVLLQEDFSQSFNFAYVDFHDAAEWNEHQIGRVLGVGFAPTVFLIQNKLAFEFNFRPDREEDPERDAKVGKFYTYKNLAEFMHRDYNDHNMTEVLPRAGFLTLSRRALARSLVHGIDGGSTQAISKFFNVFDVVVV